ncbi:hypothetical protein DXG01_011993, partial [Tephrocybe rancida]
RIEVPSEGSSFAVEWLPFLDQPLLADYQATYSSSALAKALSKEDARVHRGPGALKILLGSGDPPGVDARSSSKGKERATERGPSSSAHGPDRGLKLTKILGTLLDTSPPYARSLLRHPPYAGDRK